MPRHLQNKHEVTEQSRRYPMTPGHPIVTLIFAFQGAESGQIWGLEAESWGAPFSHARQSNIPTTRVTCVRWTARLQAWWSFILLLVLFLSPFTTYSHCSPLLLPSPHASNHVKNILYQRCGIAQQTIRPVHHRRRGCLRPDQLPGRTSRREEE